MRIALVADSYPPLRSSAAVQLRDLSLELVAQGHQVTVLIPAPAQKEPWTIETADGVEIVRLRTGKVKDIGYVRRTINEFFLPFLMGWQLWRSPLRLQRWDGVVWYSPTIFLGPLVSYLKARSSCRAYLILRDVFPNWALDMGLLRKGPAYAFFSAVARYQYSVADVIGVQASGNMKYVERWLAKVRGRRAEVLQNWLREAPAQGCSINVRGGDFQKRTVFIYAGNMGVAQGAEIFIRLAEKLQSHEELGFVFVGRGSEAERLRSASQHLGNVRFFDEVEPREIPAIYAQCAVGLVSLDPRHQSHNIPGKFVSYMHAGLPVLACINPGNELVEMIRRENVGKVSTSLDVAELAKNALLLVDEIAADASFGDRCRTLAMETFSPRAAAGQITRALVEVAPVDVTGTMVEPAHDAQGISASR